MIYPYKCACTHEFEIICRVADYQKEPPCPKCNFPARRVFTPYQVCGADDWNNTEYNPGLGVVTRNRKDAKAIAKRMGLEEVGTTKTDSMHKEFDKKRADTRQARWDSV